MKHKVTKTPRATLERLYKWRQTPKGKACVERELAKAKAKRDEYLKLYPLEPKPVPLHALPKEEQLRIKREKRQAWRKTPAGKAARLREYRAPQVKLRKRLRNRLRSFMLQNCISERNYEVIGCSPKFLCQWIESKFQEGMSWENTTEWHVDHIIPCSSFDLSQEDQVKQCFHYTNLQPLWAKDNFKKSDNIVPNTQSELLIHYTG